MTPESPTLPLPKPPTYVYIAFAAVLLALWLPFIPTWYTFMHGWRVEIGASLLIAPALVYLFVRARTFADLNPISKQEFLLIVFPMLALIAWSGASGVWAHSWKSAVHHTALWAIYTAFYFLVRNVIDTGREFSKVLWTVTFTLVLISLPAVVEYCGFLIYGGSNSPATRRYTVWGEQIVTILPLLLVCLVRLKGRQFWYCVSAVAALWLLVFCSLGRMNILLFTFGVVAVGAGIAINDGYRRYFPKFLLVAVVLATAPLPLHVFSFFADTPSVPMISRLNDSEGISSSSNFRKLMISVASEMITANPVFGVGADNFWIETNKYRAVYGERNPGDVNLAMAEDEVPGTAHNEFLQITAELGLVGGGIIALLLAGIGLLGLRALRGIRTGSLLGYAAAVGVFAFLASSMVSSYSFRVPQNSLVFLFVLAVASKCFLGKRPESAPVLMTPRTLRFACAAGILACCILISYSAIRVSSVIATDSANSTVDPIAASALYVLAADLDDENPNARFRHAMRLFQDKKYAEAERWLRETIATGHARSSDFSYLATVQSLTGNDAEAERTMRTAATLYPRSPFVLTRYSLILANNGQTDLAAQTFERAIDIDREAANTWRAVIELGPKAATDLAATNPAYLHVMQLSPTTSMYAVVAERMIRHPEELKFSARSF